MHACIITKQAKSMIDRRYPDWPVVFEKRKDKLWGTIQVYKNMQL